MALDLKQTTVDWLVCDCGNQPNLDGFYTCLTSGRIVSPSINGEWDEVHYICLGCNTIYNTDTMDSLGTASPEIQETNKNIDWTAL